MLSIGEFSQAAKLSIKTLRYYHELGILEPEKVDPATGYRYYSASSLDRAEEIGRWKDMGFSLAEIRKLLPLLQRGDMEEVRSLIAAKARELEQQEQNIQEKRERLLEWEPTSSAPGHLEGPVNVLDEQPLSYLFVPIKGPYHHIGKGFAHISREMNEALAGPPFSLYFKLGYEEVAEMLACFPGNAANLSSSVFSGRLDKGQWVAQLYRGPYDGLGKAYQALFDYCRIHEITAAPPAREIYLQGPGECQPADFLTEVRMLIKADEGE